MVELQYETDAISDVGRNAVKHIVGMRESLALGTGGQDGAILVEVVEVAALLDGRVIVEGNNDSGILVMLVAKLVSMIVEESVVVCGSAHVLDLDNLECNGCPDNFFVKLKQGGEFVLGGRNNYSSMGIKAK